MDSAVGSPRVLVVDDDVRNIFALSSVLERHRMQVLSAGNGRDAASPTVVPTRLSWPT